MSGKEVYVVRLYLLQMSFSLVPFDLILSVSGRSSAYGDVQEQGTGRTEGGSDRGVVTGAGSGSQEMLVSEDTNTSQMMHSLRRHLLKKLLEYMPELRGVGGVRAIPYMQVRQSLIYVTSGWSL